MEGIVIDAKSWAVDPVGVRQVISRGTEAGINADLSATGQCAERKKQEEGEEVAGTADHGEEIHENLDADTEVDVLLIAGMGVEVIGGTPVELVPLAEFAPDDKTNGQHADASRNPAYGLEQGRFLAGEMIGDCVREIRDGLGQFLA